MIHDIEDAITLFACLLATLACSFMTVAGLAVNDMIITFGCGTFAVAIASVGAIKLWRFAWAPFI